VSMEGEGPPSPCVLQLSVVRRKPALHRTVAVAHIAPSSFVRFRSLTFLFSDHASTLLLALQSQWALGRPVADERFWVWFSMRQRLSAKLKTHK
jgi:hypothetical protein